MKKITTIILTLTFIFSGMVSGEEFKKGMCSSDLILNQNLKAPRSGERYVKNGRYHWYTKSIVKEAHILQKHLNRLGFNAGKVDGVIGPNTKGAILRMQKFLGTKQDGYVGPKTRALLNDSCGSSLSYSDNDKEYSGDLKIAHGEDSIKKIIENSSHYKKRVFGKNIIKVGGDNFLDDLNIGSVDDDNLSFASLKKESLSNVAISDYSKTNIQVEGVDESDITKTDGEYIYTISKSKELFIFKASNPKEMKTVAKITAEKNEFMREMYINDNKLILISNYWGGGSVNTSYKTKMIAPYYNNKTFTRVEIYNIKNPEKPTKIKKIDFEGNLSDSRITDNHLYFITNKWFYNTNSILPVVKIDNKISTNMFGEDFYYIDEPFQSKNLTSISALNLNDLSQISSKKILMPRIGDIYVSKNNFYLSYNKFIDTNILYKELEKKISDLVAEREEELDSEKNKNEIDKKYKDKITSLIVDFLSENRDGFEKTKIEKFSLDSVKISAKSSGEISGYVLNQFSMHEDENENFFVSTTVNSGWMPWQFVRFLGGNSVSRNLENNLYSLDKNLKNIDSIKGLANGERIKSVRYINNHAYLVTFKETDPLFNIDISNPERLKLLGELKIDGFSQYLHPVFKDRLIGLGREVYTDKNGRVVNGGIKVTLFDISKNKPKEIKSIVLGKSGSYSEALNNHKAILISDSKNIMAFPAVTYESDSWKDRKNSVILLNIEKNNISKISYLSQNSDWGDEQAKRVVRIGDVLHAVAPIKSRSFNLKDGKNIGEIIFEEKKEITTY